MLGLSGASLGALSALIFSGGFIDALAGGGGLVTVPAYLAVGLDPRLVLGTNKLASAIGTAAAGAHYTVRRRIPLRELALPFAAAVAGGAAGSELAQRLAPGALRWVVIGLLPIAATVVLAHHDFGGRDESGSLQPGQRTRRAAAFAFPIGCYDGFFGPGAGVFDALAWSRLCRYDLLGATARAKILNLASNGAALLAFLIGGRVQWRLGLAMGAVSVLGNLAGSHVGLKGGAKAIRPAIVLACLGLMAKLLAGAAAR